MIRLEPRLTVRWPYQQRDGIISVFRCGQLYLAQREFDHLCEKAQTQYKGHCQSMAQSYLLSCSYRERNLVHILSFYIFTETK